ncbi:MAG: plasmid pRiA4b ORF-3 family protein [Deltaproteobacteria bacterium]|jgi:hypothetical protein|nr:plasmid pRiA4b ORF-3 family protein [Deltaproteobacteria bacterium]
MSDSKKTKSPPPKKIVAKKATLKEVTPKAPVRPTDYGRAPLYSFQIELKGISPKIWREFYVPADINLQDFHQTLVHVMGWRGGHQCFFEIKGVQYDDFGDDGMDLIAAVLGLPSANFAAEEDNHQYLDSITLDSLGLRKGTKIQYVYDMGDNWEHVITVKNLNYVPSQPQSRRGCLGGARACPPEDCGSIPGYNKVLKAVADPEHKGIHDITMWLNEDYDPEKFDLAKVNSLLAEIWGDDFDEDDD